MLFKLLVVQGLHNVVDGVNGGPVSADRELTTGGSVGSRWMLLDGPNLWGLFKERMVLGGDDSSKQHIARHRRLAIIPLPESCLGP